jgi:hypothetical protein
LKLINRPQFIISHSPALMCSLHAARLQTCFHSAPQNGSATVLNTTSKNHQLQLVLCSSRNPLLPGFNSYFLMNCKILAFFSSPFPFLFFLGAWGSSFTATTVAKKCRVVSPSLPLCQGHVSVRPVNPPRFLKAASLWHLSGVCSWLLALFIHRSLCCDRERRCVRSRPIMRWGGVFAPATHTPRVLSSSGAFPLAPCDEYFICSFVRSLASVPCLMSRLRLLRVQN